jgi:hypothetical protein
MKFIRILTAAIVLFTLVSVSSTVPAAEEVRPESASQGTNELPKASGPALWDYLQRVDYTANWKMWPGKSAFYPGTQPHGALLTTYVNPIAYKAIEGKTGTLPSHSIIVKENYDPQKELKSITVMYRVKDFNPEAGNWFWAKYAPDGKVDAAGKVEMCIECHGKQKDNDYIWTAPLK